MRHYSLPLNRWLPVPGTWRTQLPVPSSTAQKFVFHHIRPLTSLTMAPTCMGLPNGIQTVPPLQISIIAGIQNELFVCATVTGSAQDKFNRRYTAAEYQAFLKNQQAALWHLPFGNFFQGNFEAFNGPNPIDITLP